MKTEIKFYIKFSTLCFIIFLILFFLEIKLKDTNNSYKKKNQDFESQLDSIQILILGSSHSEDDINPAYFDKYTYNASNNSQSIYYDSQIAFKYLNKLIKLKFVIISLSYFSLGYSLNDEIENLRITYYSNYWKIYPEKRNNFKLNNYFFCLSGFGKINLMFKDKSDSNLFNNGFYSNPIVNKKEVLINDTLQGFKRASLHNSILKNENYLDNVNYLDSLLKILIKKNIVPIIITTPVHYNYYKYLNKYYLNLNKNIITQLCLKFQCKYYNFMQDKRFEDMDFFNFDHLNYNGAEKFSKILNEIIKKDN